MNSTPPAAAPDSPAPPGAAALLAGARALDHFLAAGFARLEPPVLQPASVFLDMSGEDIRGRLYLVSDASGAELCLRPDYTAPVCLAYLASPEAGKPAQYAYLGPVFRARPGQSGEMLQTGLESYGRADVEAADAEILALALEAAELAGAGPLKVKIGDAKLFDSALSALRLPDVWLRRIRRGLARGRALETILANGGGQGALSQSGVLAALESADHAGAKALVEDLLAIAGIATVGGRSAGEIADRFLEQAAAAFAVPRRRASSRRRSAASWRSPAIPIPPRASCARSPTTRSSTSARRSIRSTSASASSPRAACRSRRSAIRPASCATSTITPASSSRRSTPPIRPRGRRSAAAATTASPAGSAPRPTFPAIGAAVWIERLPAREARK